jgi:DHA3 family tetracycline resistance protein-like MFS transporter
MVVGGALADRISPRADHARVHGLARRGSRPLAVLVLTGRVQMWEVCGIAAVFGIVDAFFLPARSSILPKVVADPSSSRRLLSERDDVRLDHSGPGSGA